MSNEAYTSISNRVLSLEDIIRQQEQTITLVLQRLRDVEQYAAAESRNREQAQQQVYQLLGERGGTSAEAAQQMQAILQSQNERLSALQADVQGQAAALRGVDDKYGAALRGMEQRMQADVGGVHQRAQTGETASLEAMRNLQAQLQGVSSAAQAIDTRSRDDLLAVQQQLGAELAAQRQRTDNLESAIRDALRDVHGSLTGDIRSGDAQHRSDLESAVQRVNQSLEALDQRTRADMDQLHSVEQGDVNELGRRIGELERSLREVLQASANGLASEVAQVAQHSQNLDHRQATAHQALLQELAKHDSQLESVDLNWRASVTDLGALVRESIAAAQQQAAAGDQALQLQLKALEDRLSAATDAATRSLSDVARTVQEECVKPVNEVRRVLSAQDQRLARVAHDYATMQESLKDFGTHVDQDASQFRQVVEAALRASHADLLERIQLTSAAITMQLDPETLRVEVQRALTKLWEDAKGVFLTQRSLNDVEAQLATLESAVRVELCALAERHNDVQRSVDTIRLAQQRIIAGDSATGAAGHRTSVEVNMNHGGGGGAASGSTSSPPSSVDHESVPARPSSKGVAAKSEVLSPVRHHSAIQTDQLPSPAVRASQSDEPLPPPLPPLRAYTSEPAHQTPLPRPRVEEIDTGEEVEDEAGQGTSSRRDDDVLQRHEQDIQNLRASLDRLRLAQAQGQDKVSAAALQEKAEEEREEGRQSAESKESDTPVAVREARRAAARAGEAVQDARSAALEAGGAYRDAASAADQAGTSSHKAYTAATQAGVSSREARRAAAEAAESLRAAEAAQHETLKAANEMQLALKRVALLEETMQQRLTELNAKELRRAENMGNWVPRPKSGEQPTQPSSHTSVATVMVPRPSSQRSNFALDDGDDNAKPGEAEAENQRLYAEEEEPPHARRVSATSAAHMSYSPTKKKTSTRPASAPQAWVEPMTSASSQDNLVEVPGISTGEVFIIRQEKSDRMTPASLRPRASFNAQPPLAPTMQKDPTSASTTAAAAGPANPATSSESDVSQPAPPRRGSGLSEVLLPTHQFVRKREYNNFKDFTKQEIDSIWVELLNLRRNHGMSKEEVLLQVSQSKEQLLSTVLHILQRQETETLGMLTSIKVQLAELRNDAAAMREVRVFPIDNGRNLEELMRAIGGGTSTPTIAGDRPSTSTVANAAPTVLQTQLPPLPFTAGNNPNPNPDNTVSGERATPPAERPLCSSDRDGDTAASSGRSVTPLVPQIIPPVVRRRSSLPSKDKLPEVFYVETASSYPSQLVSKPQPCDVPSVSRLETTVRGPQHGHAYAAAAPVDPSTVAPAARPMEPESATAQYRPTGLIPPAPQPSPKKGSLPSSAIIDASRRLSLGPSGIVTDASTQHPASENAAHGVANQSAATVSKPLQHKYQVERETSLGMPQRYLKEGKSPRNPAGSAFHLNPLQGMSGTLHSSPPRREAEARPPTYEDTQESSHRVLESEPKPHKSHPPHYQPLHSSALSQVSKGTAVAPPLQLTDTARERYQPMAITEGSDIYYESVEEQRPARRLLRRSSASADNTPTHASTSLRVVRDTLPPGHHLYNQVLPAPDGHALMPRNNGHDVAPLSPRGVQQRRQVYQRQQQEAQYPPLLPLQQPHRDYTPVRDPSTDAVCTSTSRSSRSPSVRVLPAKGPIHLGRYSPPRHEVMEEAEPQKGQQEAKDGSRDGVGGNDASLPSPSLSSHSQQQQHADHNPHVYAPHSGRDGTVYSTSQSLAGSPSPERGSRGCSPASRHSLAATSTATTGAAGSTVPVRVLDGPANAASAVRNAAQPISSTTIRIHPYQGQREL
jgi:hypothetical protein